MKRVTRSRVVKVAAKTEVEATPVPAQVVEEAQEPQEPGEGSSRTDYDKIIRTYKEKARSPKNAIRSHCVECMGGMIAEVARCTSTGCSLYPFKMGKNPYHALARNQDDTED